MGFHAAIPAAFAKDVKEAGEGEEAEGEGLGRIDPGGEDADIVFGGISPTVAAVFDVVTGEAEPDERRGPG